MNIKKINLVKKNFYFAIVVVVLLFAIGFVIAAWDSSKASHETLYTDTIEPKTVGKTVNVVGGLLVDGQPIGAGYWGLLGNNIYYDKGNVGIGTTTPSAKLDVAGDINASGTVCDKNGCIGAGDGGVVSWSNIQDIPAGFTDGIDNVGAGLTTMAVHSLTSNVPDCPSGWEKLWDGYSLAGSFLAGSYEAFNDLGSSGSCIKEFHPIPFIECQSPTLCDYYTSGDFAMWLSTDTSDTGGISGIENIRSHISRCSVCRKPATIIVEHSLSTTIPSCPSNTNKLWEGYSLHGLYLGQGFNSVQDLESPGSCIKEFRPLPIIECSGPTTCDYYTSGDFGMWLSTDISDTAGISGVDNIKPHIGRCVVCEEEYGGAGGGGGASLPTCSNGQILKYNSATGQWECSFGGGGGGGTLQTAKVVGTTDISASTSWADMSDMTITMNTNGGDVLLMFSGNIRASGNDNVAGELRFDVDGAARHYMVTEAGDGAYQNDFAMHWIETNLPAGSHTFKVQWKGTNANVQQNGATRPRVFTAIELGGGGSTQWAESGNDIYNANSGNVGIGTASSTKKLEVNGTMGFTGGQGPICIFARACPNGWIDNGLGGYIYCVDPVACGLFPGEVASTCPYRLGAPLVAGGGWNWCHPKICCNQ